MDAQRKSYHEIYNLLETAEKAIRGRDRTKQISSNETKVGSSDRSHLLKYLGNWVTSLQPNAWTIATNAIFAIDVSFTREVGGAE